jgi:hypothetical protein
MPMKIRSGARSRALVRRYHPDRGAAVGREAGLTFQIGRTRRLLLSQMFHPERERL